MITGLGEKIDNRDFVMYEPIQSLGLHSAGYRIRGFFGSLIDTYTKLEIMMVL